MNNAPRAPTLVMILQYIIFLSLSLSLSLWLAIVESKLNVIYVRGNAFSFVRARASVFGVCASANAHARVRA